MTANNSAIQESTGSLNPYPLRYVRASQLVISPYNVRKTKRNPESIESLAANIKAKGLMHALTVHEMPKKKGVQLYGVTAGGGRYEAIQLLLNRGLIKDEEDLVKVNVAPVEDAYALSLSENIERENLHPADEYEGFKRMIDGGESIEDTAAAFGVTPLVVQRRLRLANAEPSFIEMFRADHIDLDQLMALCTTDNHELQKYVWENSRGWQRGADHLRDAIIGERIDASKNPIAKFVGVEHYIAAGGAIERDLFSQNGEGGFIADSILLQRLALDKLEQHVDDVRAEGWSWIETKISFTHADKTEYREAPETRRNPTDDEAKRLEEISVELDDLLEKQDEDDLTEDEGRRYDALEDEQNAIEAKCFSYAPEVMAHAGAVISINDAGTVKIVRGLVRKEDVKALARESAQAAAVAAAQSGEKAPVAKSTTGYSERLYQRMTAHETLAMQAKLATSPNTALAVLIAEIASEIFGHQYRGAYGICASVRRSRLDNHADNLEDNPAHAALYQLHKSWLAKLPKKQKDLLPWLLKQSRDELVELLALCSALSLDCVRNNDRRSPERDVLLDALELDMADYWKPSPANFLAHISKPQILATVREALNGAAVTAIQDLKKGPMIEGAYERLESTRWLPKFMRRKSRKAKSGE